MPGEIEILSRYWGNVAGGTSTRFFVSQQHHYYPRHSFSSVICQLGKRAASLLPISNSNWNSHASRCQKVPETLDLLLSLTC